MCEIVPSFGHHQVLAKAVVVLALVSRLQVLLVRIAVLWWHPLVTKLFEIGRYWLLMEKILHQLRLVVYPIIYKVLYIPGGCSSIRISEPSTVVPGWILVYFFSVSGRPPLFRAVFLVWSVTLCVWGDGSDFRRTAVSCSKATPVTLMMHPRFWTLDDFHHLVGGFKYFTCSPRKLGKISNLTSIFFKWVGSTTKQNRVVSIIVVFFPVAGSTVTSQFQRQEMQKVVFLMSSNFTCRNGSK